jgi:type II secretory pathway pseudopilin PulG
MTNQDYSLILKYWQRNIRCTLNADRGFTPHQSKAADVPSVKIHFNRRRRNFGAGFTLIETFVAIVILTTALAGALGLAAQGFFSADIAGDQITATFLAQDGMEYVRYARDGARLNGHSALYYERGGSDNANVDCVSNDPANRNYCYFDSSRDVTTSVPISCGVSGCPAINYDKTSGFYNYVNPPSGYSSIPNSSVVSGSGNVLTKFVRSLSIISPVCDVAKTMCNSDEGKAEVTVSWIGRGGAHSVVVEEDIYDQSQ